jgi:O-antigen ligase
MIVIYFLLAIISLSLGVIAYQVLIRWTTLPGLLSSHKSAQLFGAWLVASVVFSSYFFVVQVPGLPDITIERALFAVILAILLVDLTVGRLGAAKNRNIEYLMLTFLVICVVSMIFFGFRQVLPGWPQPWFLFITGYLIPFLAFIFVKYRFRNDDDARVLFGTLFCFGIYLCSIAFFEFEGLKSWIYPRFIIDPTIELHLDRARGPFLNSAFNGAAMNLSFLAGVALLSNRRRIPKMAMCLLLLTFFPAIFFTQTRSAYLIFSVVVLGLLFFYQTHLPKWKLFSIPVAFLAIFAVVNIPKVVSNERRTGGVYQVEEVKIRYALIEKSLSLIADYPLVGVGLGQFIPASVTKYRGRVSFPEGATPDTQHNHILGLMVELGLVGASFYISVILLFFKRVLQLRAVAATSETMDPNLPLILFLGGMVFIINGLFVEPSYSLFLNAAFFSFLGLADGLVNRHIYTSGATDHGGRTRSAGTEGLVRTTA